MEYIVLSFSQFLKLVFSFNRLWNYRDILFFYRSSSSRVFLSQNCIFFIPLTAWIIQSWKSFKQSWKFQQYYQSDVHNYASTLKWERTTSYLHNFGYSLNFRQPIYVFNSMPLIFTGKCIFFGFITIFLTRPYPLCVV